MFNFKSLCSVLGAAALLVGAGQAWAVPSLTVSSSSDLLALQVGDTFTLDVALDRDGLAIDGLNFELPISATLFSVPVVDQSGSVVPAGDSFVVVGPTGVAFSYLDLSLTPVTTDGNVFSLELEALAAGSGEFAITPLTASASSGFNTFFAEFGELGLVGTPFQVRAKPPVGPGPEVIPEPVTAGLVLCGLVSLGAAASRRRRL